MSSEPLLPSSVTATTPAQSYKRQLLSTVLIPLLLIAGIIYVAIAGEGVPKDPLGLANYYLKRCVVGHAYGRKG
jgi:membrane dipeptidase